MKNWHTRSEDALELYDAIRLDWTHYDFTESSDNVDNRVPAVVFGNDVEVRSNRVAPFNGAIPDSFVREYHIGYNNRDYVVAIVSTICGAARKFYFSIAIPSRGDLPQDCLFYCKL